FGGEQRARTAPAIDDFVHDQQHAVLIADATHFAPILRTRNMAAGARADGLANDCGHSLGSLETDLLLQVACCHHVALGPVETEVVSVMIHTWYVNHTVHEGAEERLIDGKVAADTHRCKCRPVIATAPGNDLVTLGESAQELDLLGDLEGSLDRF